MQSINSIKKEMQGKMPVASVSTPFNKDGSIDYAGLRNAVDFIIEAGTGLVLITYGDSLFSILTDRDIAEVTKVVIEQTRKRALVVASTGMWWTGECIRFAKYCRDMGADILMSLPPNWADSCSVETLKNHYTAISREMPVMLITAMGSKGIPLAVIEGLLEEKNNVVAIKDDICGGYGRRMASLVNGRWAVLSGGLKENHLDILPYGADSYLSVYMRFKPEISYAYLRSIRAGDMAGAVDIINKFERPYFRMIEKTGSDFDSVIHASMEIAGICGRWRRKPYKDLDDGQMEIVKDFLDNCRI
jgi:4-hydroxy-tetrahydrodipicolinate synthase